MSIRGIFVSLDGPGGAGKSATAALVCGQLASRGLQVCATAEPSSTPLGRMIRASTDIYRGMALACLVAGDRHHHLATEIRPQRQAGAIVICDRYLPSSLVLQRMDDVGWDTIWQLNSGAEPPDLAVILNAAPAVLTRRLAGRGGTHSRFERRPDGPATEAALYQDRRQAYCPWLACLQHRHNRQHARRRRGYSHRPYPPFARRPEHSWRPAACHS